MKYLLTLVVLPICATVPIQDDTTACLRTNVAVLGAGIAGVTAAQVLANHSISDFILVEYQDRIGGRLNEIEFGQKVDGTPYVVETGANWVQGLGGSDRLENPVYTLGNKAKKHKIRTLYSDYKNIMTYDETGYSNFTEILDQFDAAFERFTVRAGCLLPSFRDLTARGGLHFAGWNPPPSDPRAQVAEWYGFDSEFTFTPEESSGTFAVAENLTFRYFSNENRFVFDQRGFSAILRNEAATFLGSMDKRLLLNTVVTGVNYSGNGVTVQTKNGTCIDAKYAIMTFSLGVMQRNVIEFHPPLPHWKRIAIGSFKMGTYTKIFLQFEKAFWDQTQYILRADPRARGYYPQFQPLDLPGILPGSGILMVTVVHQQAYKVEAQTNVETQSEIMAVLRRMYGDDIPDPKQIYYFRWAQAPWYGCFNGLSTVIKSLRRPLLANMRKRRSYGSYANWPPYTGLEEYHNYRSNVGRLYFAGEATSREFFGYLHGAYYEGYETGETIAARLRADIYCPIGGG